MIDEYEKMWTSYRKSELFLPAPEPPRESICHVTPFLLLSGLSQARKIPVSTEDERTMIAL